MYWVILSFLVFILTVLIFYKIKFKKIVSEIETEKSNIYLCDNRINDIQNQMIIFQESISKISQEIAEIEKTVKRKK